MLSCMMFLKSLKDNTFISTNWYICTMIKLQTPVTDSKNKVSISYSDKIMMLGSCFSDNIGEQLTSLGFDVLVNPFGTLYNPVSILGSIEKMAEGYEFTNADCIQIGAGDERWCSFSHHTSFARQTPEEFIQNANQSLAKAAEFFRSCNKVIITLGTSWYFWHNEKDMIVSNCLKRPAAEFERKRLAVSEIADTLRKINALCNCSEDGIQPKEFIFTVSPIRHFKDGAHGNQLSKSALLLGIDEVLEEIKADYFPAYEIMMDELRDYRFYAEDMCHPTSQATNYIRTRFLDWAMPSAEQPILEEKARLWRQASHIKK